MKKIIFFIILFFANFSILNSTEIKLEKIIDNLNKPWSLSFIDEKKLILTEKSGKLLLLNLKSRNITEIKHNLDILEHGQGG